MSLLADNQKFIIDIGENYIKQTYRNRCKILSPNGVLSLQVPVKKYKNHSQVKEIQIDYDTNWSQNHFRSLETAYNNSPFFLYYKDDIVKFFSKKHKFLFEMNFEILEFLQKKIGNKSEICISEDYIKLDSSEIDYREIINPKKKSTLASQKPYFQCFGDNFTENLSILDMLFNLGNETISYL
jgi:hypothetical protein